MKPAFSSQRQQFSGKEIQPFIPKDFTLQLASPDHTTICGTGTFSLIESYCERRR
jgi:hypothetical protein